MQEKAARSAAEVAMSPNASGAAGAALLLNCNTGTVSNAFADGETSVVSSGRSGTSRVNWQTWSGTGEAGLQAATPAKFIKYSTCRTMSTPSLVTPRNMVGCLVELGTIGGRQSSQPNSYRLQAAMLLRKSCPRFALHAPCRFRFTPLEDRGTGTLARFERPAHDDIPRETLRKQAHSERTRCHRYVWLCHARARVSSRAPWLQGPRERSQAPWLQGPRGPEACSNH